MYYFLDWIKSQDDEGFEPSLPENIGFALVADNKNIHDRWGVFECSPEEYNALKDKEVSQSLKALLNSAIKFPPIIAYSRFEIEERSKTTKFTKTDFDNEFCQIIKNNLIKIKTNNYIFAQSISDEIGYLSKGEYYWVVSAQKDMFGKLVVSWVSDDYFFYENPSGDFDLNESELRKIMST